MNRQYDRFGKNISRTLSPYRIKLKYSSYRTCYYCGAKSPWSNYCSDPCAIQYMTERMEENPIVVGFIPEWFPIRKMEALQRDKYMCQDCGIIDRVEVHHIIPLKCDGGNELENLVSLCYDCHKHYTKFWSQILPRHADEETQFYNWLHGFKLMQKRYGRLKILS